MLAVLRRPIRSLSLVGVLTALAAELMVLLPASTAARFGDAANPYH